MRLRTSSLSVRTITPNQVIKAAIRRKSLPKEGFPFHVVAMDGKAQCLPAWDNKYVQRHVHEKTLTVFGLLRTVTCCLVSARAKPCIEAVPVPASTNEMGCFKLAFGELLRHFGRLFKLVTYDAGAASESNALAVLKAGKHYLFRLRDERRIIEVRKNVTIWSHTKTLLRVHSETWEDGSLSSSEDRYYNSSLQPEKLSPAQWLSLVRNHWSVENNCHWTFDAILKEDDRPVIEMDPVGALAIALLRRLAYNLVTLFRSVTQRAEHRRGTPWKTVMRWFYNACIAATAQQLEGLRARQLIAAHS